MAKKIMYNEINEKADSLFTKQNDWKQILSLYGCQDFQLQPLLFSWKKWDLIKALENISYAAGQLANIRREKDKSGKWVYPIKNLNAARHLALTALDQLLERDPMNTKGLHNKAYIHYNTVIASNNKIVPIYKELGIDRLQDFESAKSVYETILQQNNQDIKANYRLARLYMTAEKSTGRFLKDYLQAKYGSSSCAFRRKLIARFEKVLVIYENLSTAKAKADFRSEWLRSLYNLGVLYTRQTFIFFPQDNQLTLDTYLLNRDAYETVPPYRQCGDEMNLRKAFHYLLLIQKEYHISTQGTLHMQDYLCKANDMHRVYPVSPKELWYRLGDAFAELYRLYSFHREGNVDRAFRNAVFFYYLALQWAVHTRQSGNNAHESYDYIAKALNDILRLQHVPSIMDPSLKPIRAKTTDPVLIR